MEQVPEHLLREKGPLQAAILAPDALAGEPDLGAGGRCRCPLSPVAGSEATVSNPPRSSGLRSSVLGLGPPGWALRPLRPERLAGVETPTLDLVLDAADRG
jgi:hypothetical protein